MYIRAKSITEAWNRILNVVWYQGEELKSERGLTKEIFNLMVSVREPNNEEIEGFPMGKKELEEYAKQLLNSDKSGFEYTYGERLRGWGAEILGEPIDQIAEIIKRLKKNPNTRRATAATWIPPIDFDNTEVPCLILADFKIRNEKLNLTCTFRSNDMYGAWPANAYGLSNLNRFVAKETGIEPGSLTTLSISAHVYEHDFLNIKKQLSLD
ncbi:MAG: thymidylate synthase [Candidatus Altiarchaeota archaeon]